MKPKSRILFFGTPQIAIPSLDILSKNCQIIGVGVPPDKPFGRKRVMKACPVKTFALKQDLPIFEINNKKTLTDVVAKLDFDLGIVIAFGMIFPKHLLEDKPFVNVHFSLLPKYRGASPVQSAILNGDTKTGITWQKMTYELDAGAILFSKCYDIANKNTQDIWTYFSEKTAELFPEFITQFFDNQIIPISQKPEEVTFCGKFQKEDGLINPKEESADYIWKKYLAFTPWPGIFWQNEAQKRVKILEMHKDMQSKDDISICSSLPSINGNSRRLYIQKIQIEGKKVMSAKDFRNSKRSEFPVFFV